MIYSIYNNDIKHGDWLLLTDGSYSVFTESIVSGMGHSVAFSNNKVLQSGKDYVTQRMVDQKEEWETLWKKKGHNIKCVKHGK